MDRRPVESGMIKSVGYDSETKQLEVEFQSGGVYRYANVPPEKYTGLLAAESAGKYFAAEIKPNHEFVKV